MSLGQYGVLGCEIECVKQIAKEIGSYILPIFEQMKEELSILDTHIFFDAHNCFENVNADISRIYLMLRECYFEKICTKFPIAQALLFKKQHSQQQDEINLIDLYFQNWGIPEGNRIRPHFTMLYHSSYYVEDIKKILEEHKVLKNKINQLKTIVFTQIGVVQLDSFGNPLENGLLCLYPLHSL